MEPTKFENYIKKVLNGREIKPSETAWDRIKGQIQNENKPNKSTYSRYGIAVGFVGILMLSVLYFLADKPTINQEAQIAAKPSAPLIEKEKKEHLIAPVPKELSFITTVAQSSEDKSNGLPDINEKSKNKIVLSEDSQMMETEVIQNNIPNDSNEIIEAKIAEVLSITNSLEENDNALTDIEVDSLLRQAQKEILTEKFINSDKTVNPDALLSQVEGELDESFRDQIFDKLKSGFNKVRTAVAERNN
jgi:hypothetical protein